MKTLRPDAELMLEESRRYGEEARLIAEDKWRTFTEAWVRIEQIERTIAYLYRDRSIRIDTIEAESVENVKDIVVIGLESKIDDAFDEIDSIVEELSKAQLLANIIPSLEAHAASQA